MEFTQNGVGAMGEAQPAGNFHYLLVSKGDCLFPVPVKRIAYFESQEKYTLIQGLDMQHESTVSLNTLEAKLPPDQFVRVHRRHLLNVDYVRAFKRRGPRQLEVLLTVPCQSTLVVSRRHMAKVLARFGHLQG